MTYWGEWYPPARPIAVKDGIAARSKKGKIGGTWWSQRFIAALERTGIGSRLERGRKYARRGQVIDIAIRNSAVRARVQGTMPRPYNVTISFSRYSDAQWEQIFDALSSQALFSAMLLGGEMPQEIESVFARCRLSLFPVSARDVRTRCDCPDSANPCKHIAAVYYILAEQFDRDPFLIFSLRGRNRDSVLESLRKRRSGSTPACDGAEDAGPHRAAGQEPDGGAVPPLSDCTVSFWEAADSLDTFPLHLYQKPVLEAAALKRLGPSLFKVGNKDLATLLEPVYPKARKYVLGKLLQSEQDQGARKKRPSPR